MKPSVAPTRRMIEISLARASTETRIVAPMMMMETAANARPSPRPVPAATVCYVWDAKIAAGTSLDNAFTRRMRYLVVRSGDNALSDWQSERRDIANQVVSLANQVRAEAGLGPLAVSGCLTSSAQSWANHLAESGTFGHNLSGCAGAQNIASNYSAEGTVQSWRSSDGHYRTMTGPDSQIGVGVAQVADGSIRVVADFG